MTHRIDVGREGGTIVFQVQGLLDAAAFAALKASVAAVTECRGAARVVLKEGTQLDRACLPRLRALGAEVVAESPYLARWIAESEG